MQGIRLLTENIKTFLREQFNFFFKQTCWWHRFAAHCPLGQDAQSPIQPVHEHLSHSSGTALDLPQPYGSDTHNRWHSKYEQHNLWWGLIKSKKTWIKRLILFFTQRSKIPVFVLFRHVIGCTHEVQLPLDCGKIPGITTGCQWASTIRVLALLHGKHCTWGMVNTVSSHFQDRHCMQDPGNATKSNKIVPRTAQCPFKSCLLAADWGLSVRPTLTVELFT